MATPITMVSNDQALLKLLQLVSPALPVGAYSYSEGLEVLVDQGMTSPSEIVHWLEQEMAFGLVRLEGAVIYAVYEAATIGDKGAIADWNHWLSALRDSEESRQQSWAMGRALIRLMVDLDPRLAPKTKAIPPPCNFALGFALLAHHWAIPAQPAVLGYLHSWASNLVTAAVKLVPLGQTQGQQMLLQLYPALAATAAECQALPPEDLALSSWGAALASMQHEAMYSRLFRS